MQFYWAMRLWGSLMRRGADGVGSEIICTVGVMIR